jgi:hypothetical protein
MKVSLLAGVLAAANIWVYQAVASSLLSPARELSGRRAKSPSSMTAASGALPTVDLGYAIHQATINVCLFLFSWLITRALFHYEYAQRHKNDISLARK